MYTDLMQLEKELDEFLNDFGYQVVDIQLAGVRQNKTFRLFVDRASGERVTLDDCAALAPQVILFLEMKGVYNESSSLEVSSAGLDRVLKRNRDFERFLGREVKVTLREGSQKRSIVGELASFNDDILAITVSGPGKEESHKRARETPAGTSQPSTTMSIDRGSLERVSLIPKVEI
jgi:ribosome maturation factor RimP